jgi:hypothetical protein
MAGQGLQTVEQRETSAATFFPNPLDLSDFNIQPLIVAGDPNGNPPDSPEDRVDPNTTTSPYAGVGSLEIVLPGEGDFLGSGTAISPRHILTAGHVLDIVNEDGIADPAPENVIFNLNVGGDLSQSITASELHIFPEYEGFSNSLNNDLAIVTLSSDLPDDVPIYDIYRDPLVPDDILTLVGYGTSGNGIDGYEEGTASPSIKRTGNNQVEDLEILTPLLPELSEVFMFDFDGPDASTNSFAFLGSGLTLGNDIETTVGPGDSGGPSFLMDGDTPVLAGVNTFAFAFPNFGTPESGITQGVFGTGGGGVVLSEPDKLAWIDGIIGSVVGDEPGSISGTKWNDINGDGVQDAGEPGLEGWTIFLDLNENGSLDTDEPNTLTDASGNYTFLDLAPGTYTVAEVLQPGWMQTAPSVGTFELLNADFSDDTGAPSLDGFTIDNTGASVDGLWHLSTGRGNQSGHSADDSLYFGTGEGANGGGNYDVGDTAGRIVSPVIDLSSLASAELSFNYFLNVEPFQGTDFARVQVARDGGSFQTIASKGDGLNVVPNSAPSWRSATLDLTPYAGSEIQIQFDFDTLDSSFNTLEGWYVDDVVVSGESNGTHVVTVGSGEEIDEINFGNQLTETQGVSAIANDPLLNPDTSDASQSAIAPLPISETTFALEEDYKPLTLGTDSPFGEFAMPARSDGRAVAVGAAIAPDPFVPIAGPNEGLASLFGWD